MTKHNSVLALMALVVVSCSSRFTDTSTVALDSGSFGGGETGGGASGTAGSSGRSGTGGAHSGGRASTGGAPAGGSGGTAADASACPAARPVVGSHCTPGLQCVYGNICCGGGFACGPDGTWQVLAVGCACQPPPPDAGPLSCGTEMCTTNEVCVHPASNQCGPQPLCVPELDGGVCPPGTSWQQYCGGSSSGGCVENPKQAPPHCAPMPSACGGTPTCSCLPGICGPSGADICTAVRERDVDCLCIAP